MKILCILLVLTPLLAWAEPQIKIFSLSNRPVAATLDIVRSLLKPGEQVWPDERLQRLIVKAYPTTLDEVQKLLEQIDVAAPQVWLTISQSGSRPYSAGGAGIGLTPRGRVVGNAQQIQGGQQVNETQKLLVMSGEKGEITVGQDIPTVQPYWNYVNGLGLLPGSIVFQRVSTGFAVEPTVVGDKVRLRITPWMSYISQQGNGRIEFSQAASSLTVNNGETITIGSSSGGSSSQSSSYGLILGGGYQEQASSNTITVTAEIQMEGP